MSLWDTVREAVADAGTKLSELDEQHKLSERAEQFSQTALQELEPVTRKKMTAICAKNTMSYKRAMAYFMPGKRQEQLRAARLQQRQRRGRLRKHAVAHR